MRIEEIQVRTRKLDEFSSKEYAVLSVFYFDRFDGMSLRRLLGKKPPAGKKITLMIFNPPLYKLLSVGSSYMFRGFVSFGYGNTFLVCEEAITSHGEVISPEDFTEEEEEEEQ